MSDLSKSDVATTSPAVSCVLDEDLRFVEFSAGWVAFCRGANLAAELLPVGRSLRDLLPERSAQVEALARWIAGRGPEEAWHSLDPRGDWRLWPASPGASEVRATLRAPARERLEARLENPLFSRSGDRVEGLNGPGRRLLAARPDLAEVGELGRWLSRRPQPRELRRISALVIEGRTLWQPVLHFPRTDAGFGVLVKAMRALLHDSANSLSAVRMMAEVAKRGSRAYADSGKTLNSIIHHLDLATTTLGRLRRLVQTESPRVLDAAGLYGVAAEILRSELDRREVEADLSGLEPPEPELEGRADAFLMLALGTLLFTLGRAAEGDVVKLEARVVDDEVWRVEGTLVASETPRPWLANPELDPEGLDRLADALGGTWRRFPAGSRPLWRLELPV